MTVIFESEAQKLFYMGALGEVTIKIKQMEVIHKEFVKPMDDAVVIPKEESDLWLERRKPKEENAEPSEQS